MNQVRIYYLEMTSPDSLSAKRQPDDFTISEARVKQYQINRLLYQLVGEPWDWTDKLEHSDAEWQEYVERDELRTWLAYSQGSIAGYYELEKREDGDIEIAYFGLTPKFISMGFGGYFLSHAIKSAWAWEGAKRITVNTCSLDHPSAIQNYIARGFKVYREVSETK